VRCIIDGLPGIANANWRGRAESFYTAFTIGDCGEPHPHLPEDLSMSDIRVIKKYPNRRLYDTATSCYITLADVKKLVLENVEFKVIDAKTSEDLTRSILLQIIIDEEAGGVPMFSSDMLSQIIRFYGNAMQGMMGSFLEKNIQTFMQIQQRLQEQSRGVYGANAMLNPDAWTEFVKMQGPAIQGLMTNYLEQSASAFLQMQQQLQQQTRDLFSRMPFGNFAAGAFSPGGAPADKPGGKTDDGSK
jgi:polyhydroxyalkanoate synthesis repressor PhaR